MMALEHNGLGKSKASSRACLGRTMRPRWSRWQSRWDHHQQLRSL